MNNIVPASLQRLQPADIIRVAGLAEAALGQEYSRVCVMRETRRQDTSLRGVVDVPHTMQSLTSPVHTPADDAHDAGHTATQTCAVQVDVKSTTAIVSTCSCRTRPATVCAHAAALLYHWLAKPDLFEVPSTGQNELQPASGAKSHVIKENGREESVDDVVATNGQSAVVVSNNANLLTILTQLGLSELRGIARAYGLVPAGMSRQQLAEAIQDCLRQAEVVRKMASALEKNQRQLLAALTLAGGLIADDDLRGMFERFSLGQANQLQRVLLGLQGKALLFRTSMSGIDLSARVGLGGALLDIGWYVPVEVRSALRVTVPVTAYDLAQIEEQGRELHTQHVLPYAFLHDLLLFARALDGYQLKPEDHWPVAGGSIARAQETLSNARLASNHLGDNTIVVPEPEDMPSARMLASLQAVVARPPALLRFAIRVLRLTGIVYRESESRAVLRVLPNAAQLLLSGKRTEVLRDLFHAWLKQASYSELWTLQEQGVRICCRATALQVPLLRQGELDAECSEARQTLVGILSQTPREQWINFQAFARFVYRLNPLFLQRRQKLYSTPHWWIEQDSKKPLKPLLWNDWLRGEQQYLAQLLQGSLHWWGVCDVVLSDEGRLLAFRLTPQAAGMLLSEEVPEQASVEQSTNLFEVVGTDELLVQCSDQAWPLLELLEQFAQPAGVRFDYLRYHLTPSTFSRALSRGRRAAPLLSLFQSLASAKGQSSEALQQLSARCAQWVASYGKVRIYTGVTLFETIEPSVMREVSATTSVEEQIVRSIQPDLHILKNGATARVLDELKQRGQAPLVHDEESYGTE